MTEQPSRAPYQDAATSTDERVADLLRRMTLEEKAAQTSAPFALTTDVHAPPAEGWGCAVSALSGLGLPPKEAAAAGNELQRKHLEETRLGIPVLLAEECLIGLKMRDATVFPDAIAQAATWDPDLVEEMTSVIGRLGAGMGVRQALSPLADVTRDPRWGRLDETYGEDPYLVGSMTTAFVRGLQSAVPDAPIVATLKHFIAYSASDGARNCEPVEVGPRTLREVHALPFEMAIRVGGARAVMPSYNSVDGEAVQASAGLLRGLLREELDFDGLVISDLGGVKRLSTEHGVAQDHGDAVVRSLRAGMDLDLYDLPSAPEIVRAVGEGRLEEEVLDRAVARVLRTKFELGLFDRPYVDLDAAPATLDPPEARALARRIAERSIVLLKNDPVDGTPVLPLDPAVRSIAVIGPHADRPMGLLGHYSYQIADSLLQQFKEFMNPEARGGAEAELPEPQPEPEVSETADPADALDDIKWVLSSDMVQLKVESVPIVTPLEGIRHRAGDGVEVTHTPGCPVQDEDRSGIEAAVAAARAADVAVVVVGDQSSIGIMGTVGEGIDSTTCALPGVQRELVEAVAASGTPTVVVLSHGRPYVLDWTARTVPALVSAFFGGEEAGSAIAAVLFGDHNPSGHTPVSYPSTVGALPVAYGRATRLKDTYYDGSATALFPFGHGLSYTSFDYMDLQVSADQAPTDGIITVSCKVANTGDRDGDEVVQLYVRDVVARTVRPWRELKGFRRVALAAGEAKYVSFELSADRFALWDPREGWVVEPGTVELHIGRSVADIRLITKVELTGHVHRAGRGRVLVTPTRVSDSPG